MTARPPDPSDGTRATAPGRPGRRRRVPCAGLVLAGTGFVVAGFAYDLAFAGLPYLDPTPQMQADWTRHKAIAGVLTDMGLGLVLAGLAVALVRRLRGLRGG